MSYRNGKLGLAFFVLLGFVAVPTPGAHAVQTFHDSVVSPVPAPNTPHVLDGRVLAVAEVGDTMILGGRFTQVSSPDGRNVYDRDNLVAFNKITGQISTSFIPRTDGDVTSLVVAPDGESVYIGGLFDTVDGRGPIALARLQIDDGSRTPGFSPPTLSGRIKDMKLADGRLWIAGTFTHVNGNSQPALATLDADTGAFNPFMSLQLSEPREEDHTLQVLKFDITPDGEDLIAIGNFTRIEGQTRWQAGMLDIGGTGAVLPDWRTSFFTTPCSPSFDSYMRDVDFSPDGDFFVIVTTGSYGGGPPGACDTSSRFETEVTGLDIEPTWVEYTGGDTTLSVAVTGTAVYTGGHFRWQNNPWAGDSPGRGAVDRPGLSALDPETGVPFRWNPTRTLGVGVFDLLATEDGLWIASDTDRIGDWLYRGRIAFLPLDGGSVVPVPYAGELPGLLYTAPAGQTSALHRRNFDGSVPGSPTAADPGGIAWQNTQGAFMLSGQLYLGHSNGDFTRRTYDGTHFGPPVTIDVADQLVVDTPWHMSVQNSNGMFYDDGRIYYAGPQSNQLVYRSFNIESDIVGARQFGASAGITNLDWRLVRGMMLAGSHLYFGYESTPSSLRRVAFDNGRVTGPIEVISTGAEWNNRSMFLFADSPNHQPEAAFVVSCAELTCEVNAGKSFDPDGSITSYAWTFGDGGTGSEVTASHTYADPGSYDIGLTVTDDRGGRDSALQTVSVSVSEPVSFVGAAETNGNRDIFEVTVPGGVEAGDQLLLFLTLNATDRTVSDPAGVPGWTKLGQESTSSAVTAVWQKQAAASDGGSPVSIGLSTFTKGAMTVVAYRGGGDRDVVVRDWESAPETTASTTHTTPSMEGIPGTWLVGYWGEKSSATTSWTSPDGQIRRSATFGSGGGRISSLLTDSGATVGSGTVGGLSATADASSGQASMWSFLIGAQP